MRAIVQRVTKGRVIVDGEVIGAINRGYVVLVAFRSGDDVTRMTYMVDKLANLRLFPDEEDKMNLSLDDIAGEILVISQFTLYGDARKGRRPSFSDSAPAAEAQELYETFLSLLRERGLRVQAGQFQAYMQVELTNDGPVTIMLDSEKLF
ncbi:MAG: D-aminoacyl-tRNA deacylase [Symbiobacteriaceae bacterium]|nr:D-aminoacyl-tRNA deacylase [Symbiobacteriaceae bacterium]